MSDTEYSVQKDLKDTREILLNEIKEIRKENEIFRASLATMGNRIEVVEDTILNLRNEIAQLKIDNKSLQSELCTWKDKIIDAQNRQRRRNVRIKFLPELPETQDMVPFLISWWCQLGYKISEGDLERAHRVTRKFRSDKARDTVVAFARERKRDDFLQFFKSLGHVTYKSTKVLIFADLAPETVQKRSLLNPIASLIIKNKYKFTWGFPASIIIYHKGEKLIASNINEGKWLLDKLGISYDPLTLTNPVRNSSQRSSSLIGVSANNINSNKSVSSNSGQQSPEEDSSSAEMDQSQQDTTTPSEKKRKDLCEASPELKTRKKQRHKKKK